VVVSKGANARRGRAVSIDPKVAAVEREFFRTHPEETRRQAREERASAAFSRRRRTFTEEPTARPPPRTRTGRRKRQTTAVERGMRAGPGGYPNDSQHRAEFASFVAAVLDKATSFYRSVKEAYPARNNLEMDLAAWSPETAVPKEELWDILPGAAPLRTLLQYGEPPTGPPRKLWPAYYESADLLPNSPRLREVVRERGRKSTAGGKHDWPGNVSIELKVAGHLIQEIQGFGIETRSVKQDVLASQWLDILYGSGRRAGPREAAKAVTAKIAGRSRAQVEKLANDVRALGVEMTDAPQ